MNREGKRIIKALEKNAVEELNKMQLKFYPDLTDKFNDEMSYEKIKQD